MQLKICKKNLKHNWKLIAFITILELMPDGSNTVDNNIKVVLF